MFEHNSGQTCSPRIAFGQSTLSGPVEGSPWTRIVSGNCEAAKFSRENLRNSSDVFQAAAKRLNSLRPSPPLKTRVFPCPSVLLVHSSYRFFFFSLSLALSLSPSSVPISIPSPLRLIPLLSQKSILSFPPPLRQEAVSEAASLYFQSEKIAERPGEECEREGGSESERVREPSSRGEKAPFLSLLPLSIQSFCRVPRSSSCAQYRKMCAALSNSCAPALWLALYLAPFLALILRKESTWKM